MEKFTQEAGSLIIDRLILAIQENKQYLSERASPSAGRPSTSRTATSPTG